MLNPFPDLLSLGFFAPTLLRLMLGLVFVAGAYVQWQRKDELAQLRFPLIGGGLWVVWLSIAAHLVVGLMFFFGYYTQIAALGGIVAGLKGLVWSTRYPRFFSFCRLEYGFILVISLSLLFSGAGAIAFDIPL